MRKQIVRRLCGAALLAATAAQAGAQELPPQLGAYMPLYPGLYFSGAYAHEDADASYDQQGHRQPSAAAQTPGAPTRFSRDSVLAQFSWHVPLFESYGFPFISSRTWLARATLRYASVGTGGGLADYIDSHPELSKGGSGIGDLSLEFGTFLYGSDHWRTRSGHPLALLALVGIDLPYGSYDRSAPVNAGSNSVALKAGLGLHWQPWHGAFLETGAWYRSYQLNEQPAFGQLAPRAQGDELSFDASLSQRVWRGLYLGLDYQRRKGQSNQYQDPQFAPNQPAAASGSDVFPTPGTYRDGGTSLESAGFAAHYFIGQRWLASLHYGRTLGGRSGQFQLPFTQRTPANCVPGAVTCSESADGSALVDGLGLARSLAGDSIGLSIRYQFGQGDAFPCANCTQ